MHGPPLVGWSLVVLCAAATGYCLWRARAGAPAARTGARLEALMGIGMTLMAVPVWSMAAPAAVWWGCAALYAAMAAWSGRTGLRRHPHHVVDSLAMVYMAVAMSARTAAPDMAGMVGAEPPEAGGVPLVTGLLLLYYAAYVLVNGVRLAPAALAPAGPSGLPAAHRPEVVGACRVVTGTVMCTMLLTL